MCIRDSLGGVLVRQHFFCSLEFVDELLLASAGKVVGVNLFCVLNRLFEFRLIRFLDQVTLRSLERFGRVVYLLLGGVWIFKDFFCVGEGVGKCVLTGGDVVV